MTERIAITGLGAVSSVAPDIPGYARAIKEGKRGFSQLSDERLSTLRASHAGLVKNFRANPDDPHSVRELDRNVHLALKALREAKSRAGLEETPLGARGGIVFGTCSGGMLSIEKHYEGLIAGRDILDPALLFSKRYYTTAKVLAWAAGAAGPVMSVVTACAASGGAIAQGADLIRTGLADIVIAGGSDAFSPSTLVGFDALKATAEGTCAPFSHPVGLNLGEGAAFIVLEKMTAAKERGAEILAELLGAGLSNDAYHPTAPDPSARGQMAAMTSALADAGIEAHRIDYVNAHGTGTRANDPAETRAVAKLLGEAAPSTPVSSTKSMIGHCLGGAGALEACASILGAKEGVFPCTAGFNEPREGCDLDYIPDVGRPWKGRIILSNSFGFAGNNACLIIDTEPQATPISANEIKEKRKSVITGFGLVSSLGPGAGLLASEDSGIGPVTESGTLPNGLQVGKVPDIDLRRAGRRLDLKGMDRCSIFLALAAKEALEAAKIKPRPRVTEKIGLVMGIATGPGQGEEEHLKAVFESNFQINRLGAFPYVVPNEVAGNVARTLMLKGHSTVIATGSGAGLFSLISSCAAVELGHAHTLLAGSSDELTQRSLEDGCKVGHWGPGTEITPGEGAAALVVEDWETAKERGAHVMGEVLGHAMITDPSNPREADREKLQAEILKRLLETSGLHPRDIASVSYSGDVEGFCGSEAVRRVLEKDVPLVNLTTRLGLAEASTSAVNLAVQLKSAKPMEIVVATWISREGLAAATAVRAL